MARCSRALAAFAALAAGASSAVGGEWVTDLGAGVLASSNLGNAGAGPDVHGDFAATASLATGPAFEFGSRAQTRLALAAELRGESYARFDGMSNATLGIEASLDHKLGLGRTVPHLFLDVSAARLEYRRAVRDGWLFGVDGGARLPIGERFQARALAGLDHRHGRREAQLAPGVPSDVFDQSSRWLQLGADVGVGARLVLQAELGARYGDVSYTETADVGDTFGDVAAVARDPVFGDATVVERLRARVQTLRLGALWPIGGHAALNVAFERDIAHTGSGDIYARSLTVLGVAYRFE